MKGSSYMPQFDDFMISNGYQIFLFRDSNDRYSYLGPLYSYIYNLETKFHIKQVNNDDSEKGLIDELGNSMPFKLFHGYTIPITVEIVEVKPKNIHYLESASRNLAETIYQLFNGKLESLGVHKNKYDGDDSLELFAERIKIGDQVIEQIVPHLGLENILKLKIYEINFIIETTKKYLRRKKSPYLVL